MSERFASIVLERALASLRRFTFYFLFSTLLFEMRSQCSSDTNLLGIYTVVRRRALPDCRKVNEREEHISPQVTKCLAFYLSISNIWLNLIESVINFCDGMPSVIGIHRTSHKEFSYLSIRSARSWMSSIHGRDASERYSGKNTDRKGGRGGSVKIKLKIKSKLQSN